MDECACALSSSQKDFLFVMVQSTEKLHRMQMPTFLERIAIHLQLRFGLDINHGDLRLSLAGGELIPIAYSFLDLVFVGAMSRQRDKHVQDGRMSLHLNYHPNSAFVAARRTALVAIANFMIDFVECWHCGVAATM